MALKTGWEFDPKFSGRPREEAARRKLDPIREHYKSMERHRQKALETEAGVVRRFGLAADRKKLLQEARAERMKALVGDHRASEHLFKPEGPASEEEAVAAGWKPGPALRRAVARVGAAAGPKTYEVHGHYDEQGRSVKVRVTVPEDEPEGPASEMEEEDERTARAVERAKYDARVGAGRFAASSRESREKFLKDVDKHGLDTALLRHGEREPHLGDRPLRDPQKEQLARLRQARAEKSVQVGPRGGRHYVTAGGTKIYVRK